MIQTVWLAGKFSPEGKIALDYVIRFKPLVGFTPQEARFARHVPIAGDTKMVGEGVEQGLRSSGCVVSRITAPDSYALESIFKQLLAVGIPNPPSR